MHGCEYARAALNCWIEAGRRIARHVVGRSRDAIEVGF